MASLRLSVTHLADNRFKRRTFRCAIEFQELFNRVVSVYDNLIDLLSFGQHRVWKRMAVFWAGAKTGDLMLDLCCGSCDLTFLMSEKVGSSGSRVSILDFNKITQPFTALFRTHESVMNVILCQISLHLCYSNLGVSVGYEYVSDMATVYGLAKEIKYLKTSIDEFLTGMELEKLVLDAGFLYAGHYVLGGGLMGNLVATR